jgi:hypothetical protein
MPWTRIGGAEGRYRALRTRGSSNGFLRLLTQVPWMTLWLNAVADMPGVCFALRAVTGSTMRL